MGKRYLIAAGAMIFAAALTGLGACVAMAQDNEGATVATSGATGAVDQREAAVVAPGVTIDTGNVTNVTGIGVIIDGGSSVGGSTGGGDNAAADE